MISYIFVVLTSLFLQTKAYEVCNYWEYDDKFTCYDTSSAIGFCCDYYNGDYHDCCYAELVWTLWYFWFGLLFGIFFLAAIIGILCRCCNKSSQRRATHVATITQETIPVSEIDRCVEIKLASAPPSYDHTMMQSMPVVGQAYPAGSGFPQQPPYQQPYYPPPALPLHENHPTDVSHQQSETNQQSTTNLN